MCSCSLLPVIQHQKQFLPRALNVSVSSAPAGVFFLSPAALPICFFSLTGLTDMRLTACVFAEINRVRVSLFHHQGKKELNLPEGLGPQVTLQEKLFVPCKEHPDVSGPLPTSTIYHYILPCPISPIIKDNAHILHELDRFNILI